MQGIEPALSSYLLSLGDDELILGHRDSEWCGYAPILEEDIAFANIALDEIGHASTWYGLVSVLDGEDPQKYPDRLVYTRPAHEYRNIQMVELPNGDWAFSVLRQYLFDTGESVRLQALQASAFASLAEAAAKIRTDEIYHQRHSRAWVQRLGLGTEESNSRMQAALDHLWPYALQMFMPLDEDPLLIESGYIPDPGRLQSEWEGIVISFFEDCELTPPRQKSQKISRVDHTPHLKVLLADMQSVARLEPDGEW